MNKLETDDESLSKAFDKVLNEKRVCRYGHYISWSLFDDAKFCPKCGIETVVRPNCKCGKVIEFTTKFCSNCGTKNERYVDVPK